MKFHKKKKKTHLLKILTRNGIICKVFLMDGFLQMVACTSEIIIIIQNIIAMFIEREE